MGSGAARFWAGEDPRDCPEDGEGVYLPDADDELELTLHRLVALEFCDVERLLLGLFGLTLDPRGVLRCRPLDLVPYI